MIPRGMDFSRGSRARVYVLTFVGTCFCIAAAFLIDSYSWTTGVWTWGDRPSNNFVIPVVLAPPLFYYLLSKLRELSLAQQELISLASTDMLTNCLNRRAFTALVDGYIEKVVARQGSPSGALLVIDVDYFKAVNDRFGHEQGDVALRLLAETFKANVREIDLVGRLGGEEFGVFMPGIDQAGTDRIADRIRNAVQLVRFVPDREPYGLSVSIGGATFIGAITFAGLYRQADRRLYAAKHSGRNRVDIVPVGLAA